MKRILIGALIALSAATTTFAGGERMTKKNLEERMMEVIDKQDITEVIYKYARSLDRMDADLMKSTYWPEGTEEHQDPLFPVFKYDDNGHKFVPIAMKGFESLKYTQHRISNPLIEVDGDRATAEAYVWAYHVHEEDGVDKEGILGGRHLFRFEKRDGEWKIMHRSTIFDWNQNQDATAIWGGDYSDKYKGKRNREDDSYNYIQRNK
ncbi:hypothetical protein PM10SUCC1_00720 [Propionigenium maris DSM 9537]|uniref:SnoaL-like domain-containing protein n=1 Tax=Propionigenium maris DSM 9537 TaxID=1123000 RepID=A0A9W6LLD2_9FUSO|nr:nuclear transport factor 2 family protein [Propionigenium maris]GLI54557.1 hypothetical protein PM10SUCC1_00720 [Propionigenium maris DSM 9537]